MKGSRELQNLFLSKKNAGDGSNVAPAAEGGGPGSDGGIQAVNDSLMRNGAFD